MIVSKCVFFGFFFLNNSMICNSDNGSPTIDTAHPAGLGTRLTLVACPAPTCENSPVQSLAQPLLHVLLLASSDNVFSGLFDVSAITNRLLRQLVS